MEWRDVIRFFAAYCAVTLAGMGISMLMHRRLDEFDFVHALIIAATVTICRAIREVRP